LIFVSAIIETENLLVEVTEKMEWFDTNVSPFESAFHETPEVLQSISVHLPFHIALSMIDNLMDVFFVESPVRVAIIGREIRAVLDVIFHHRMHSGFRSVLNDLSADFASRPTLFKASDDDLIVPSHLVQFGAFVSVHETGLTADEGFVNFDVPLHFSPVIILHCQSDSVKHEPCRLLSDANCTMNLIRGNAILAVGNHPCSSKPFIQTNWTIFKNGSDLDAELLFGVFGLALADETSGNKFNVFAATSWTGDAIGPTLRYKVIQAVVLTAVKDDRFLQGLRLFHNNTRVPEMGYCVKYINPHSSQFGVDFSDFDPNKAFAFLSVSVPPW
jgi:hypothetical protein